jgi:hypothetical protein
MLGKMNAYHSIRMVGIDMKLILIRYVYQTLLLF